MRCFLLSSVAVAALLSAGQMAIAQGTSSAPGGSDRPATESPAEKTPAATKAQNDSHENPSAARPRAGQSDQKSESSKTSSETKEPDGRSKVSQEKKDAPKATSDSKEPPAKSSGSSHEKSAPSKASSETREAPSKSSTSQTAPSTPAKSSAETNPTAPKSSSGAAPAANTATTPSAGTGESKTGETENGHSSQQKAASASNAASVPPEKAAKINEVISREKVESVENVKFSVSVGVSVPSRVSVRQLPASIVEIVPEYRGYDYVVVRHEIVIVEPRTRKIVTVIHRGGGSASSAHSSTHLSLSADRRRILKQKLVTTSSPRSARTSVRLVVGAEVPESYELREFPTDVMDEDPELREYEYIVDEDNVVLVDRRDRRVIEIID